MYKIGEFAKLCDCTPKLIRFYDDVGLLKPDYVDESSGYRYYSSEQVKIFQKIILFREVGFTLKEITQELLFSSMEDILTALEKKEKELLAKYKLCQKLTKNYRGLVYMEKRFEFITGGSKDSIIIKSEESILTELFTDKQNIQPIIEILDDLMNNNLKDTKLDIGDLLNFINTYKGSINYVYINGESDYNKIAVREPRPKGCIIHIKCPPTQDLKKIDLLAELIQSTIDEKGMILFGIDLDNTVSEINAEILEFY